MLVWDAPNMDMCLAEIIGRKASSATRPRMDALADWFAHRAHAGDRVEAAVFANVAPGHESRLASWVANLRQWGWSVFVKPKQRRQDDVDDEMVRHIERHFRQGNLVDLVIASHDGRAFVPLLRRYLDSGVSVTVLGFRERMSAELLACGAIFVDLEYVPGVFIEPLPRTNLFDLPRGGRWFEALHPLEGARPPEPEPEPEVVTPAPPVELDRLGVVDFIRGALAEAEGGALSLQAAGDLLRHHFAGFTLESSGYLSVTDLLEELQADGDICITKAGNGHLLQLAGAEPQQAEPVVASQPAVGSLPDEDDDGVIIDLDAPEHRVTAEPTDALQDREPAPVPLAATAAGAPAGTEAHADAEADACRTATQERRDKAGKGQRDKDRPKEGKHAKAGKAKRDRAERADGTDDASWSDTPTAAADGTNPIYRMFGYDPKRTD